MSEKNSKKRSWILSFKRLKIGKMSNTGEEVNLRNGPINNTSSNINSRNSFRKSLIKMHTRMKNCVQRRISTTSSTRHTIHVTERPTTSSNSSSRITLCTPTKYKENIYSMGPGKQEGTSEPQSEPINRQTLPLPKLPQFSSNIPTDEILKLSNYYWYWGPLTRVDAESRLRGTPDGTFLIRDSTAISYLFTISFRSVGKTLHCRIEYCRGRYALFDQKGYTSIAELVEKAMEISENGIYCYSRNKEINEPNYPVRLIKPISRYVTVRSLKYLCRFVIRQRTNINDIPKLPLPSSIKSYLQQEGQYF